MFLMDHFLLFSKKIDEKTVISFQSGPNLVSFTFKENVPPNLRRGEKMDLLEEYLPLDILQDDKHSLLSLHMKTKVVKHVPWINISIRHLTLDT